MIKRKKLNILMALVMAMTLMFGSTVCFAAETDDVAEAVEQERAVARSQSGTVTKSGWYSFPEDVLISYTVSIQAEWDEGYSSTIKGGSAAAEISQMPEGTSYTTGMYKQKISGNRITYKLYLFKNHIQCNNVDLTFYVDEYGCVQ